MMELLGMMPRKVNTLSERLFLTKFTIFFPRWIIFWSFQIALGGRYSRDFFNRYGDLRHIRRLRFWPLNKVLLEKYEFNEQDANDMADFLVPILDFVPEKRPTAAQLLAHPWINVGPRIRELSSPQLDQPHPSADAPAEKQRKEKDERDAMAVGLGNIAIDGSSKSIKDPQPSPKPSKGSISASR